MIQNHSKHWTLNELLFFEKGAMSFLEREIPHEIVASILKGATSCSWLGKWKLLTVTTKENRVRVVGVWQEALRKIGQDRSAEFIERWKIAPLFVAFCQPETFESFQWVAPEFVKIFSIQEVGGAVRSLELTALSHGIGLHGIMGILVPTVGEPIKSVLGIPKDYQIVYFGVMGYPDEEAGVKFPDIAELCYAETWATVFQAK